MATLTEHEQSSIDQANASGLTPVVFIHGLWLLPSSWDRWRTLFEEAGYSTVAPGWPDDPETVQQAKEHPEVFAHKTVGQVADHFEEVARALTKKPAVIGHSFGGLVVREAVLADPTVARSLVLLCSGPAALDQRAEVLGRMADGIDTVGLAPVWAITRMMELESGSEPHQDPAVTAFLERRFMSNDPGCLAAMARILATTGDRTTELAAVAPPTLVMCGEDDDAWAPKIQQETASQLGARFVSLPEAAHSPAAERPEVTARQLAEFWDAS